MKTVQYEARNIPFQPIIPIWVVPGERGLMIEPFHASLRRLKTINHREPLIKSEKMHRPQCGQDRMLTQSFISGRVCVTCTCERTNRTKIRIEMWDEWWQRLCTGAVKRTPGPVLMGIHEGPILRHAQWQVPFVRATWNINFTSRNERKKNCLSNSTFVTKYFRYLYRTIASNTTYVYSRRLKPKLIV